MSARPLPDPALPWPIARAGVYLCAEKESLRLTAYQCQAKKWSCGWGETDGVGPRTKWTKTYADQRFCDSLTHYSDEVRAMTTGPTNDNEHAALVVLAYNIGLRDDKRKKGLYHSTVLRQHNAGNKAAAARAFDLFNKFTNPDTGKLEVSNGLTLRRKQEAALYLTPTSDVAVLGDMPQEVAAESPMRASPIIQSGAVAGTAGGLQLLASLSDGAKSAGDHVGVLGGVAAQVQSVAGQVSGFVGFTPQQIVGAAIVAAAGVAIYQRIKQRQGGWA